MPTAQGNQRHEAMEAPIPLNRCPVGAKRSITFWKSQVKALENEPKQWKGWGEPPETKTNSMETRSLVMLTPY